MGNGIVHRTPESVRMMQVIQVIAVRGYGSAADPVREVTQYYSLDGDLLAERDPEHGVAEKRLGKHDQEYPRADEAKPSSA